MGKKMSAETVEKLMRINRDKHDSIFISGNKYGYKVDVNHPLISPLYDQFKFEIGCNILSDKERFQFENLIIQRYGKTKK